MRRRLLNFKRLFICLHNELFTPHFILNRKPVCAHLRQILTSAARVIVDGLRLPTLKLRVQYDFSCVASVPSSCMIKAPHDCTGIGHVAALHCCITASAMTSNDLKDKSEALRATFTGWPFSPLPFD